MKKFLMGCLAATPGILFAATEWDQQYLAENEARRLINLETGCLGSKTSMKGKYKITKVPEGYRVSGAWWLVSCNIFPPVSPTPSAALPPDTPVPPQGALVSWNRPVTRADGTALAATEIKGYHVYLKGAKVDFTAGTSFLIPTLPTLPVATPSGKNEVILRTEDTNGLVSNPSVTLVVGK